MITQIVYVAMNVYVYMVLFMYNFIGTCMLTSHNSIKSPYVVVRPHFLEMWNIYRRRGKIRWAKHSRFQLYEVFRGNTFAVHWPPVFIICL